MNRLDEQERRFQKPLLKLINLFLLWQDSELWVDTPKQTLHFQQYMDRNLLKDAKLYLKGIESPQQMLFDRKSLFYQYIDRLARLIGSCDILYYYSRHNGELSIFRIELFTQLGNTYYPALKQTYQFIRYINRNQSDPNFSLENFYQIKKN
jgi:hypothetical protein